MTIRLAFLVNSPSKGAHGNAAGRLALGLVETGKVETTLVMARARGAAVELAENPYCSYLPHHRPYQHGSPPTRDTPGANRNNRQYQGSGADAAPRQRRRRTRDISH
jgi:hypothetical protein